MKHAPGADFTITPSCASRSMGSWLASGTVFPPSARAAMLDYQPRRHTGFPAPRLAPEAARTHFYLMRAYGRAGRNADAAREKTEWERLHAAQKPSDVLVKPEA